MPIPQYTPAPSPGNLIAGGTALAASNTYAALVDVSNAFEAQVTGVVKTGSAVAATSGVKTEGFHLYASTTLAAAVTAGGTSISVASVAGIQVTQTIVVENEVVTVSAISGTTLTISTLTRNHASGAPVYVIEEVSSAGVSLSANISGGYVANTVYSKTLYLPTSKYLYVMTNLDATNAVTIEATLDLFSAIT